MTTTHADAVETEPETPMTRLPDGVSSPRAKLVYLYLATHGAVCEENLCDGLSMKRISLYSILRTLREAGHVEKAEGRYALA
ncbi:TrmB family transcriptional regulator [Halobaculum sp. CBA1158]|uniref:TrmB family transcriptional regulator n=1 Tax=Halobaculum sp. CBA1158 TaxID=2904243 RepID=UPI001F41242B|nr:TrmB family transcriptional regulator [Halobaculum sp. CBA1158]UIO98825.1 TrmB family transcriptional regulator [Halobaculum sp. CBA1158]